MKCYAKSSENLIVQLANLPPKPPFLSKSFHLFSCTGKTHYLCISSAKNKEQNKTFLPFNFQNIGRQLVQYAASETLLHYNLNSSDYMWLYQHDKELFYTCLDAAALQSEIFSYKSFVYNFNLYILKDANILDELSRYSKCYEAVLELLFKSDSIMQNSVIRQIKLCRNEDTIKQNNRLDAINKWLNSLNKIG